MRRKKFSLLKTAAFALVALLILGGIPASPQPVPPRTETLIVSDAWGPPAGWNPLLPSPAWGWQLMYPTLFFYSTYKDTWIPYLAAGYEWVDEYTLDVRIRPEAKWWDGRPITAEDVKFTFDLGKEYSIAWVTPLWDYLESVEVVALDTIRLRLRKDVLNYFALFDALHTVVILPKHRWEVLKRTYGPRLASDFLDNDPAQIIGGGPYRLYMWSEDIWYYVRVDDWWGKDVFGLPTPKYIAHRVFKDNPSAALAFEAGEYDGAGHFFAAIYEMWTVKGLKRRTYLANPPYYLHSSIVLLYIRWKHPLNNTHVRRAIAHAIPYQDLVSKAYFNYSVVASPSFIMHTYPAYAKWINHTVVEKLGYTYDLEKAKRILDEANIIDRDGDGVRELPDGTKLGPFTIQVPYGWTDWMMMCDMIATNLRKIGIDVRTEFPDFSVWWDRLIKGEFDFIIGWDAGPGYAHPWNTFRWVLDSRLSPPAGNWAHYTKKDAIPLIDAAARETDPAKLAAIYSKLQEMALTDLPGIPLFYGAAWYAFNYEIWDGWPAEERPEVWVSPYIWNWPDNLPWLFCLVRAGETPRVPPWILLWQFPTSKFFEDLQATLAAKAAATALELLTARVDSVERRIASLEALLGRLSSDVADIRGRLAGLPTAEEINALRSAVEGVTGTLNTALALSAIALILALIALILPFVRKR
ncbi:MAG: ABC transporter substrate-binding protein [Thermofilaceae archaeon]